MAMSLSHDGAFHHLFITPGTAITLIECPSVGAPEPPAQGPPAAKAVRRSRKARER
nr:hypothetical protein [Rhodococcus wratislaviensis]